MTAYLTIQEAAELGHCEHRTIRRAIRSRQLDAVYSSRWLIARVDFENWLRRRAERRLMALALPPARKLPETPSSRVAATGSVARLRAIDRRAAK